MSLSKLAPLKALKPIYNILNAMALRVLVAVYKCVNAGNLFLQLVHFRRW